MTPTPWPQLLLSTHAGNLVPTSRLFSHLLAPSAAPWLLTGVALSDDPFLQSLDKDCGEPFAALELNGATLVALENAGEDGTSECDLWQVLEGERLSTRVPAIPVRVVDGGGPHNSEGLTHVIGLVSLHTNKLLAQLGTDYKIPEYPGVVSYKDTRALDEASRIAVLDRHLPPASSPASKPRM